MKIIDKMRNKEGYIILSIIALTLLIGSYFLFTTIKSRLDQSAHNESLAFSQMEESTRIAESLKDEAQALEKAQAMKPTNDLSEEEIMLLDNTDQEFWYALSSASQENQSIIIPELETILSKSDTLWIGPNDHRLYLTINLIDDNNEHLNQILDIAKANQIKINFFISGNFLNNEPDKVKRIYEEGHLIGNLTQTYYRGPQLIEESLEAYQQEISQVEVQYQALTGSELSPYLRPPYGAFSERTLAYNNKMGYYNVFWSFSYLDWDNNRQPDPASALEEITSHFQNGEIFNLNLNSNTNVEILPQVIIAAIEKGFEFKRLDERF